MMLVIMFRVCNMSQKIFGTRYLLPIIIFLAVANVLLYTEDEFRHYRFEHQHADFHLEPQIVKNETSVEYRLSMPILPEKEVIMSKKCIYKFVILEEVDVQPVKTPNPTMYDTFSWRMIQRQYYILHRSLLPFQVKLYFILEFNPEVDQKGYTILEEENMVFKDLIYNSDNKYESILRNFLNEDQEGCIGYIISDKNSLLDMEKVSLFAKSVEENNLICPKLGMCAKRGTYVPLDIINGTGLGSQEVEQVLDGKTLKWSTTDFTNYFKFYTSFNQMKRAEFENSFPQNIIIKIPPIFNEKTPQEQPKIAIIHYPSVGCGNFKLVTFVKTVRANAKRRDLVRQMISYGENMQAYFLLGHGEGSVAEEQEIHGDIIIGDFADTYENLRIKTMLGYQFATQNCQNVKFFFFQDDDIFMRFREFIANERLERKRSEFMICPMGGFAPVQSTQRVNYFRKHYTLIDHIPPNYRIVPYCNGPCAMLSSAAVHKLYSVAINTDDHGFRIEDMYFNGIIREKANITIYNTAGRGKFCQHVPSGDKYKIIYERLESYKSKL